MPAERRAGTIFGDQRLLERIGGSLHPGRYLGAQRRQECRRGRRFAQAIGDEVVAVAEVGDAPPCGVLLVLCFLELEAGDGVEQDALFRRGDEVGPEREPFGQRRRVAEELRLLALHRAMAASSATPSAATAKAAATAAKRSTRRRRASASCAAFSSASTVFSSWAASSLTCTDCCDTAACSSAICC